MHYACFECRKSFKRPQFSASADRFMTSSQATGQANEVAAFESDREYKCPDCGKSCSYMGLDFKSPKRTDIKAWHAAEQFIKSGKTFTRGVSRDS